MSKKKLENGEEVVEQKVVGPKSGAGSYTAIIPFPMEMAEAVCNDELSTVIASFDIPADVSACAEAEVQLYIDSNPEKLALMEKMRKTNINSEVSIRENFLKLQAILMASGDVPTADATVKINKAYTKILYYMARKGMASSLYATLKAEVKAAAPQPVPSDEDF